MAYQRKHIRDMAQTMNFRIKTTRGNRTSVTDQTVKFPTYNDLAKDPGNQMSIGFERCKKYDKWKAKIKLNRPTKSLKISSRSNFRSNHFRSAARPKINNLGLHIRNAK